MELADVDVRRMQPFQSNSRYLFDRTKETLGLLFKMHWPYRQFETARDVRKSPIHDRLLESGAVMTEAAGFERPGFFVRHGGSREFGYSYGPQGWFQDVRGECLNTAENVTLFDQSCFAKFLLQGRDACRVLNHVSAAEMDVPIGKVVYTQWLNDRGGIEADVTITRTAPDAYMIVTLGASQTRDFSWLRRSIPEDAHAFATDITAGLPMFGLMGPKSRALLEAVSGADLSDAAFPFGTSREIELGYARARVSRLTYVGELGWEIYVGADFACHVFDVLSEAGSDFGLGHGGYFAINSMRMEKGYRHWGHDIGEEDTPLQAGLGFAVGWEKPDFRGRDALLRAPAQKPPRRRLIQVKLAVTDNPPLLYHEEPIWRDDTIVGSITSGGYGHRVGASLGMGYVSHPDGVDAGFLNSGTFEVEVAGERYPASVQFKGFYDPTNARIRGSS